jgi:hypothetical protein
LVAHQLGFFRCLVGHVCLQFKPSQAALVMIRTLR